MNFHNRKLLHQHQHHYHASTMAASPTPSPHPLESLVQKPEPWLPASDFIGGVDITNHNHAHLLQVALIVMACMVAMIMSLCIISLILRHYYSRRLNHNNNRRRNSPILFHVNGDSGVVSDNDEGPMVEHPIWFIRTEGLQQSLIDSIMVFKYVKEEGLIDGTVCSVCLGEFEQQESLRLLPKCSHAFHIPCIDTWLRSHKNCPLCRAPVVHDAGANGSGSGTEVSVTEANTSPLGQNHMENMDDTNEEEIGTSPIGESEGSTLRIENDDSERGDSEILDKMLPNSDKINFHALEVEIQHMMRSVSMDSSYAPVVFTDVVGLNCDVEDSHTSLDGKINSGSKDMLIAKQGSGSGSSTIYKQASIRHALQKKPISLRGSFSHNTKLLFSRHCRSQSSTLPW